MSTSFKAGPTGRCGRSSWPVMRRLEGKYIRNEETSCWQWTATTGNNGYGIIRVSGKTHCAHRVVYELYRGEIPTGMVLDHLCRNPGCVNPDHLEPVTQRENLIRGESVPSIINSRKTHCPQGHPYRGANLRTRQSGSRVCRTCERARDRERRRKTREGGGR